MEENGQIRQGDVLLVPVEESPPTDAVVQNRVVLAEGSLTGHSHVVQAGQILTWKDKFRVVSDEPGTLTHEEHDPEPAPVIAPGQTYQIVRQREHTLDGMWQPVED